TLHPPPSTLHPPPSTLHPPPSTLHPPPSTLHPPPSTLHPPPSTLHPQPSTLHPPPSALHPPPSTLDPPPSTLHPLRLHDTCTALSVNSTILVPCSGSHAVSPRVRMQDEAAWIPNECGRVQTQRRTHTVWVVFMLWYL
ncbi:hypothetical protein T484DRAFT_1619521, partial [Baffinella frigidus]